MGSKNLNITATGWRGFFQWLKADQPAVYAAAAPIIAARVPAVLSDFDQSQTMGYLFSLGDDSSDDAVTASVLTPDLQPVDTSVLTELPTDVPDLSSVANTGASDPGTSSQVMSVVNGVIQALSPSQVTSNSVSQAVGQQIQQAAAALPPVNVSSPTTLSSLTSGLTSTTGLIILAGGLLLAGLLLSGGGSKGGGSGLTVVR